MLNIRLTHMTIPHCRLAIEGLQYLLPKIGALIITNLSVVTPTSVKIDIVVETDAVKN